MSETGFQVEERDGEIMVIQADPLLIATYNKRPNEPQLMLRRARLPITTHCSLDPGRRQTTRHASSGGLSNKKPGCAVDANWVALSRISASCGSLLTSRGFQVLP